MDNNKEYHDPDYPEAPVRPKEEPQSLSEEEKIVKIKSIIRREFATELEARENEVMLIEQRLISSRRLLHKLRYSIVSRYYLDQKLKLSNAQIQDEIAAQKDPKARSEVAAILRDSQRQIHPSVRKLLGKQTVDMDEILRTRGPRNKSRKDYSAMIKTRNYTISADKTKSLRPGALDPPDPGCSQPKKVPRHMEPKVTNVLTLDEATRNQMKQRYRIIIGNTSKYVPAASRADRSTHKWLLYIRGAREAGAGTGAGTGTGAGAGTGAGTGTGEGVPAAVTVTLHHSYAPHHIVHIDKPPFHISRRGWGEFPAKIQLHFPLADRNRPALVEHTIKLDRNYTGMQMLGAETIVDVWLYSTPEMLKYVHKEEETTNTQTNEPTDTLTQTCTQEIKQEEDWMNFFKTPTELDVDEMIIKPCKDDQKQLKLPEEIKIEPPTEIPTPTKKRIVKYMDPTTGKIYYLEMDTQLDPSKVQEIVINNTPTKIQNGVQKKKKGISLLKPEVKNQINETKNDYKNFSHIENDHCYLATPVNHVTSVAVVKKEKSLYDSLCGVIYRFTDVRQAVNYLIKKIPLISDEIRDPDFMKHFPFVVENSDIYWKLDFAKRRNIEWSRAKLINRILTEHFNGPVWRTKQILLYVRLHGHYPIRNQIAPPIQNTDSNDWSSWTDIRTESNIKEAYPSPNDVNTLTEFKFDIDSSLNDTLELSDDEEVDVLSTVSVNVKREAGSGGASLKLLPVENYDDRMKYLFIEKKCADIGIELRNEDVGNGYSYSAVHAVLLSAMRSFSEDMIRTALAVKRARDNPHGKTSVWNGSSSSPIEIGVRSVYEASQRGRLAVLTRAGQAKPHQQTTTL